MEKQQEHENNTNSKMFAIEIHPNPQQKLQKCTFKISNFPPFLLSILVIVEILIGCCLVGCVPKPPTKLTRVVAGFYSFHPSYDSDVPAPIKMVQAASVMRPKYHHKESSHFGPKTSKSHPKKLQHHYGSSHNTHSSPSQRPVSYHSNHQHDHHYGSSQGMKWQSKPQYPVSSYPTYYTQHHGTSQANKTQNSDKKQKSQLAHSPPVKYHKFPVFIKYTDSYDNLYQMQSIKDSLHWQFMFNMVDKQVALARKMAQYFGKKFHYPANILYWQIIDVMFN